MAHLASQNINDIGYAALAYIKVRNVFVRSWAGIATFAWWLPFDGPVTSVRKSERTTWPLP
jgi:hypothetical protein